MKDNDLIKRQLELLQSNIDDYRQGSLSLNSVIQNIEGVSCAIDNSSWNQEVFPIVLILEQINASVIESRASLSNDDHESINDCLIKLEKLIVAITP